MKAKGIDVNQLASSILSGTCLEHNKIKDISAEFLKDYLLLLDNFLNAPWIIVRFIQILDGMNEYSYAFILFKKLYHFNMVLEKKFWITSNSIEYKHVFMGDYYNIEEAWSIIKTNAIKHFPEEVVLFAFEKINDLHQKYVMAGQASKDIEPYEMSMLVIEEREENYRDNPIEILSKIVVQTSIAIKEKKQEFLRTTLIRWANSESELLKKISLKTIRETEIFNTSEQLDLLLGSLFSESRG